MITLHPWEYILYIIRLQNSKTDHWDLYGETATITPGSLFGAIALLGPVCVFSICLTTFTPTWFSLRASKLCSQEWVSFHCFLLPVSFFLFSGLAFPTFMFWYLHFIHKCSVFLFFYFRATILIQFFYQKSYFCNYFISGLLVFKIFVFSTSSQKEFSWYLSWIIQISYSIYWHSSVEFEFLSTWHVYVCIHMYTYIWTHAYTYTHTYVYSTWYI